MNDIDLLLSDPPGEDQAHAAIVVSGGVISNLWARPSASEALDTLRRWYAVRHTLYGIDEAGPGRVLTEAEHGPDPATATVEGIARWYSDGDSDYYALIAPIDDIDPVDRCLLEEIPAYSEEYQSEVRQAVLEAASRLEETKVPVNEVPST